MGLSCLVLQNLSRCLTLVAMLYTLDSHALAMTLSSSGEATGRAVSLTRRVKKSAGHVLAAPAVPYQVLSLGIRTIPRREAVVFLGRVADVHVLELVMRSVRSVGNGHEIRVADFTEPTGVMVAKHVGRLWRLLGFQLRKSVVRARARTRARGRGSLASRYFPHSFKTFFSILLTSGSRNAACPLRSSVSA